MSVRRTGFGICWTLLLLVSISSGARKSVAQRQPATVEQPTESYRRACELLDLRRPNEALGALAKDQHPYSVALRASLLGDPDNQEWGLQETRIDEAKRLAQSILAILEQRAEDDAEAAYLLGRLHDKGIGVPKAPAQAVYFYRVASKKNHALALANLAVHYYHGDGVPKDLKESRKLCQRADRLGSVNAEFNLGLCYQDGDGVKQNTGAAERRFKAGARKGHTDAMRALARRRLQDAVELFEKKKDEAAKKALKRCRELLEESAEAGNSHSMCFLAELHRKGLAGEKDWATAIEWYRKAAGLGHEESKRILAALENAEVIVVAWSWRADSYGFVHAKGQVRNATHVKLDGVVAVVSFFTADGTFITSDSTFLEFNPLMPGQTSPFEVVGAYNPRMKTAQLEFKFFAGRKLKSFNLDLD